MTSSLEPEIAPASRRHRDSVLRLRFPRAARVGPALDELLVRCDQSARLRADPVEVVHRFSDPLDQEVIGLLAASVAYGRVDLFKPRLQAVVEALGPEPARLAREATAGEILQAVRGFSYRMTGPEEVGALLFAAGRAQARFGSLGELARRCLESSGGHWREALDRFVGTLWQADLSPFTGEAGVTRRLAHLVASPRLNSACKRLNLYVRWMVRGPDGVDLGAWPIPRRVLVIPLDTHVHRISGLLGLTRRTDLSWRTAEEITARLRHLDPEDPVKYDFALSHLGISGECPSRRDERRCAGCPLRSICRVWDGR